MEATRKSSPTLEQVAARAYAIWEREGKPTGKAMSHWSQALRELSAEAMARRMPVASLRAAVSTAKIRSAGDKLTPRTRR